MFTFKQRRGQGFLLFVILMLLCMTTVMYALTNGTNATYQTQFFQFVGANTSSDLQNATTGQTGYGSFLFNTFKASMGIGAISGLVTAFSIGFPNYVGMFLGVAIGVVGLLSVPVALFNADSGFPLFLRAFLIAFFDLLIIIGVIGWLKGNTV